MRIGWSLVAVFLLSDASAQSPAPPLSDTRLTVHTLVREDIFAGWRADNMERFSRGEKNIDLLLEQRPGAKPELLAWKGGAQLYHAVRAHEDDRSGQFERHYQGALESFSQARTLGPASVGVAAVTGGSYVLFADRLPVKYRTSAWSDAYDSYQTLWRAQSANVGKMPAHMRGELLAGLAQSAQRTGRADESDQYLEKMLVLLKNTPYERAAQRWKDDPESAATTSIACKSCHSPGRLAARIAANEKK